MASKLPPGDNDRLQQLVNLPTAELIAVLAPLLEQLMVFVFASMRSRHSRMGACALTLAGCRRVVTGGVTVDDASRWNGGGKAWQDAGISRILPSRHVKSGAQ